ncbi:SLBB domain-containing protein [Photobacterium sp. ZSDE20]|uniref:SLBB domain-containing protein n=1 Tax=Photobacterium pectinilyticum TaxID=2906793 RepID=A0ABT1N8R8_9GAMM|nr:4Fe-4S dicluster domain-containing protein [Photobacterium sp. ZSDE20]MCQ1059649.1 SLBB domain-containing protein [Photobacterium sp. ZSDE20]MDD1825837.1 SLBB domain-containing protein [Photobacterium sp. ZSDE20]
MNPFLQQLQSAGVVGAGGAGFPIYMKLNCHVDTLIANGAECEPLLNKDQFLMLQDSQALIKGMEMVMAQVGASRGIIGIKKKNSQTITTLRPLLPASISILEMEDTYPAGDEVELVYRATGQRIPAGGLPKDIGIVVNNVESLINVYWASQDKPVTETMVTVHGEVERPFTARLPVGMRYADAIALAGRITCDDYVIIEGGPMMGSVTRDVFKPLTKTSSGLLILKAQSRVAKIKERSDAQAVKIARSACDQCGQCTALCPRALLGYPVDPRKAMRAALMADTNHAQAAQPCCGCNLCTMWSCPEGADPQRICRLAKQGLGAQNLMRSPQQLQANTLQVHPLKAYRGVATSRLMRRLEVLDYYQRPAEYLQNFPVVKQVSISLQQHIGRPAESIVEVGQQVKKGDMVARAAADSLSVAMHASIDGQVISVSDQIVIEGTGE